MNDETNDALIDYANAQEAAAVALKRRLADADLARKQPTQQPPTSQDTTQQPSPAKFTYDLEKINSVEKTGPKGPFRLVRPEDNVNNRDFEILSAVVHEKSPVYGKTHIFWLMPDSKTIGYKVKARKA